MPIQNAYTAEQLVALVRNQERRQPYRFWSLYLPTGGTVASFDAVAANEMENPAAAADHLADALAELPPARYEFSGAPLKNSKRPTRILVDLTPAPAYPQPAALSGAHDVYDDEDEVEAAGQLILEKDARIAALERQIVEMRYKVQLEQLQAQVDELRAGRDKADEDPIDKIAKLAGVFVPMFMGAGASANPAPRALAGTVPPPPAVPASAPILMDEDEEDPYMDWTGRERAILDAQVDSLVRVIGKDALAALGYLNTLPPAQLQALVQMATAQSA